jgi:hypothetical protein
MPFAKKKTFVSKTAQASAHVSAGNSNSSSLAREPAFRAIKPVLNKQSNLNKYSSLITSNQSTEPTGAYASVLVQQADPISLGSTTKNPSSLMSQIKE